ncbi:PIN domain-containing protein [Breznakiellaceae bacterium SP9]
MYKSLVFVDFENLQEINDKMVTSETKIIILVGLNLNKKSLEVAKELLDKVSSIELIKVKGQGNNALDFFIAFYLGKYVESNRNMNFAICSNDQGYDPLIKHLKEDGISIQRVDNKDSVKDTSPKSKKANKKALTEDVAVPALNAPSIPTNTDIDSKYKEIIEHFLKKQKKARPRKRETLETYLCSNQKLTDDDAKSIIELMLKNKNIEITNEKSRTIKYTN